MAAYTEDICTGREIGIEWFSPRANHHGNFIHEDYIDAAVGQDPLCEFRRRTYRLSPETKQVFCEDRGARNSR